MKLLITGGAGFIGSHLAEAFLADGLDVHIVDDLSSGKRVHIPGAAKFHQIDIRDAAAIEGLFQEEQYDVLIHHAAQMDVRKSVADPTYDAAVNIVGLLNLMEAGRACGLGKVVFASTGGAIYGEPEEIPQSEEHPAKPISPYGIAKLASEKYLHYYHVVHGIPFVALRYGNVYGPRQDPHGEAGVVSIFCQKLLSGEQAVVFGDGTQTRDYIHVSDVVSANRAALAYPKAGIFNIGTGNETSVNLLFGALRDELDPAAQCEYRPTRPGEQRRSVLGIDSARTALGWSPGMDIVEGLTQTAAWFRDSAAAKRDI